MSLHLDFNNRVVVVIGGTSGINRGIAENFARHGARVAVASRRPEKVEATVEALQALGAQAAGFAADVRDADAISTGLDRVREQFGRFDVVVSGAAGNFPALAKNLSPNGFKSVVDIDLRGTFHVMKAVYPHLRRPGAVVINISAPQAFVPMQAQVHVAAAKAGIDMLTRSLALEWGPEGIRINSIVPGPIEGTEGMARLAPTEADRQAVIDSVPLGRYGTANDIANACLMLASELGAYITGAILPVDGGWSQNHCGTLGETLARIAGDD